MAMRRLFVLIAALAASAGLMSIASARQQSRAATRAGRDAKTRADVRAVLDAQVAAWNRGDIGAFMEGYWRSPETVFISGDSVTRGWQTVHDRYRARYDSREKMGALSFLEIEIKAISRDAAVAIGRWQLTRAADTPHGRFTLILRRTRDGWRIVHDHTSSAG